MFALVVSMLFSSCKPDEPTVVFENAITIENFNQKLVEDYNKVLAVDSTALLYESMIDFDTTVDNGDVKIDIVQNVIQAHDTCYMFVHTAVGGDSLVKVNDYWMECIKIDPTKVISLDSALTRLQMADLPKPKSNKCVLRYILGPNSLKEHPCYYFGDNHHKPFVKVDCVTSDVAIVD